VKVCTWRGNLVLCGLLSRLEDLESKVEALEYSVDAEDLLGRINRLENEVEG